MAAIVTGADPVFCAELNTKKLDKHSTLSDISPR